MIGVIGEIRGFNFLDSTHIIRQKIEMKTR